jgi:hypothetical protein
MIRPSRVKPLPGYRIQLSYPDGVEGVLDLSEMVKKGIFQRLQDPSAFELVHIGEHGQVAWSEHLEICPDAAYKEISSTTLPRLTHA